MPKLPHRIAIASAGVLLALSGRGFTQPPAPNPIVIYLSDPGANDTSTAVCKAKVDPDTVTSKRNVDLNWQVMNNGCSMYTPGDVELYFVTDGIDTSFFSKRHKKADSGGHITGHVAADWHKTKNKSRHPYNVYYKGEWAGDPEIDIDDPNPNPPPAPTTPPSPSAK